MTVQQAWRDLHKCRFSDLPLDCGDTLEPGVRESEDLRDWSDKATTPDQYRIEEYIDRFDLRDKRILHIGIGNSGLAKRFHRRVKEIVGTTIDDPEIAVADGLRLPNYRAVKHNKYADSDPVPVEKFDFIIDNNPSSPCCCIRHLAALFDFFDSRLADDGQIVTDQQGLEWVTGGSNPRWGFDFDDLAAVAKVVDFAAYRVSPQVYVLSRRAPAKPGFLPLLRHRFRQARALPRRVAGRAYRRLGRKRARH